ncbi:MAG: CAP domain-containing protein [Burkholderiaceae bacterium]
MRNLQRQQVSRFGPWCGSWLLALALAGCGGGSENALDPMVAAGNGDQIRVELDSAAEIKSTSVPTDPFAAEALAAINAARAAGAVCGSLSMPPAPPVQWNTRVAYAALIQSEWMQSSNSFAHAWPDGTRVGKRLDAAGANWYLADENIAAGFGSLDDAMAGWLASPSHCEALMRSDLTEAGMAVVPGQADNTYIAYWTMVLIRPPG